MNEPKLEIVEVPHCVTLTFRKPKGDYKTTFTRIEWAALRKHLNEGMVDLPATPQKVDEDSRLVEVTIDGHGTFRRIDLPPEDMVKVQINRDSRGNTTIEGIFGFHGSRSAYLVLVPAEQTRFTLPAGEGTPFSCSNPGPEQSDD